MYYLCKEVFPKLLRLEISKLFAFKIVKSCLLKVIKNNLTYNLCMYHAHISYVSVTFSGILNAMENYLGTFRLGILLQLH